MPGYRIVSAVVPGMTAANAFHGQPAPADYTKTADGFNCITGAGRCIATMRWQIGADATTVKLDYADGQAAGNFAHNLFQCCDSESKIS